MFAASNPHVASTVVNVRPKKDVSWSRKTKIHRFCWLQPITIIMFGLTICSLSLTGQIQALLKKSLLAIQLLMLQSQVFHGFRSNPHIMPGCPRMSPHVSASQRRIRACSPEIALLRSIFKDCAGVPVVPPETAEVDTTGMWWYRDISGYFLINYITISGYMISGYFMGLSMGVFMMGKPQAYQEFNSWI